MSDPAEAGRIAREYLERHRDEASPELLGEVLRFQARHGGRLADLVAMAEAGDKRAIEAARQLAADLLDGGELPPAPLRRLASAVLRSTAKGRAGNKVRPLRDFLLAKAVWRVVRAGHDEAAAIAAVLKVAGDMGVASIETERLRDIYRRFCGIN